METQQGDDEPGRDADPATRAGEDWERRLQTLEARVEHLESAHEGLQDAVYRQAVLEDEKITELRRRTDPAREAREARSRGL